MKKVIYAFRCSRTVLAAFIMICAFAHFSATSYAEEWNIYGTFESFNWTEFDGSSRLLKESGPIFGIGASYWNEFPSHVTIKPAAEIFIGNVDYDGQACSVDPVTLVQTCVPAMSDVNYFGFMFFADVGRKVRFGDRLYINPFGGGGIRYWWRDIENGTTSDGDPTSGYVERWFMFHARFGLEAGKDISDRKQVFALAGVTVPIYNNTVAEISKIGFSNDTSVEPGIKASFFAEAGFRINDFKMVLFYDALRFSQSDPDTATDVATDITFQFVQPESRQDVYGIKLGVVF